MKKEYFLNVKQNNLKEKLRVCQLKKNKMIKE
jgi:hypothetical protein